VLFLSHFIAIIFFSTQDATISQFTKFCQISVAQIC
jgi:hypothetical protein